MGSLRPYFPKRRKGFGNLRKSSARQEEKKEGRGGWVGERKKKSGEGWVGKDKKKVRRVGWGGWVMTSSKNKKIKIKKIKNKK